MKMFYYFFLLVISLVSITASAQNANTQPPKTLLATSDIQVSFTPSQNMSPIEIESRINEINPYVLYRKGSIAEYKFQKDGKDFAYYGGPTYIQQIVTDEKIENGLLVSYVQQRFFNKKHAPSKGIPSKALDYVFPTEIDVEGHFHFTHDPSKDFFFIHSRQGYGLMLPSTFEVGQTIPSSSIVDMIGGIFGAETKMTKKYSNFLVEKMEQAITPAGTFDCVKLTGNVSVDNKSFGGNEHYDMWIARGIGIVRLDITPITKKGNGQMYTMYLNHIELK